MLRRIVPAVFATAVLATGLTACSAQGPIEVDRGDCTAILGAGAVSDNTVVLGGFGTAPEVSIPKDTVIPVTQRSIVDSSGVTKNSAIASEETIASTNFAIYDQASGDELFASAGFGGASSSNEFFVVSQAAMNPLSEAVRCAAPGERVVLAMSPADSQGLQSQIGGTFGSGMVAVIDVEAVSGFSAEGATKGLPNGYPAVVTDADGNPGVVLPPRDAPTGLNSAVRIQGTGETVSAEDAVLVQVLSVDWEGNVVNNTRDIGGPQQVLSEEESAASGVSFRGELTGKKIGSQVVVIEGGDSARVTIVDILAAG